ncbi:putative beta-galactosidase E [Cytospora mali]|uniref:Beta-galactosidase n=1 Tax=Cytospora mali TaxID=578113 RepID=A0A194VTZ4_CYTMA|nr:putative beta-galactosidase E [Valsa mali]
MVSLYQFAAALASLCCIQTLAASTGDRWPAIRDSSKRDVLQDLVTWDSHSLFVRGERIIFYSGEFHPFRLPVPGLWLDIFQKIKALGYTGVSFYVNWRLLEGNPGHFTADGVFAFEPFFEAAAEAGLYLLARPGPYINAEVAGGGFPGWLQRDPAILRTNESGYVDATSNCVANIGKIISGAQITNGGPVIAFQPENEYTNGASWLEWPDVEYIETVNKLYRDAGILVPFINNEASPIGLFTPGKPGGPDIYGHNSYPLGWTCSEHDTWTAGALPTNLRELHLEESPETPYAIPELQGGALAYWGGSWDYEDCAALIGPEAERTFYKNDLSFGVTIFSIYMVYGGTNWGNLGEPGGYTSYDYGAAIKEDRTLVREKYPEAKLIAQFIKASPAYLDATPGNLTNTTYVSTSKISTTPLFGNITNFYVTRNSDYTSLDSTAYTLSVLTSIGNVTIPQLGGTLALNGKDSKIHVTDYDVGGLNLIYSSADIYTHGASGAKRVLILYGAAGETHEFAFLSKLGKPTVEGDRSTVTIKTVGSAVVVQWEVTEDRKVLHYGSNLDVYLLWRNDAFNYWALELEAASPIGNYTSQTKETVIAKAGYLLRTAAKVGTSLHLTGDLNATSTLEIIAGLPGSNNIYFNGAKVQGVKSANGRLSATLNYSPPSLNIPDLSALEWKYIDSLPEIQPSYDDSAWTKANHANTNNDARDDWGTVFSLKTPTSLVAGDYGYHTGSIINRGHFVANGNETSLYLSTQGGSGFGHSVWINSTYLGSFNGEETPSGYNQTLSIPAGTLARGKNYVITVVIDHMGEERNWTPGYDTMKTPRGIINYGLSGHAQRDVAWKITGNLGGEQYVDQTRGPLNEGAMYAERQGYHFPKPPSEGWETRSPIEDGLDGAGIGFFDISEGLDVPLGFVFTKTAAAFRVQLFVNGYQFGKYINNLGPQTSFPVPQGILNYRGTNYIAITLWSQEEDGAKLGSLQLVSEAVIQSGMRDPGLSPLPGWEKREGAY